jgi:hypothetical protein
MRISALLAVASAALASCGASAVEDAPRAPTPARAGIEGVTVVLPRGWHTTPPVDGNVIDPLARVTVSSEPISRGATQCQVADYAPTPHGVSLVILEWEPSDDASPPPRPTRFTDSNFRLHPGGIECFSGPGGTLHFADQDRVLGAYILLGEHAEPALAQRARAVLETLRVGPRG